MICLGCFRSFVLSATRALASATRQKVADIHDRMPVILSPSDYNTWLSEEEDPSDLLRPFSSDDMRVWPISTRVNKPENDDPSILDQSSWPRMQLKLHVAVNDPCEKRDGSRKSK